MQLAAMACGMRVGVSVVDVERNGMGALRLYVNVAFGSNSTRAVSPGRAGGVRAFASNIDVHGERGIRAGYQAPGEKQQMQSGGGLESMSVAQLKDLLRAHYTSAGNLSEVDRQEFLEIVHEQNDPA
eukprot:COSAG05_NODE_15062_length_379_cov_0.921429_1_plen_126_part_11